jgi:hypothetical protein
MIILMQITVLLEDFFSNVIKDDHVESYLYARR